MNPTARDQRSALPTIMTTFRPIEDFWNSFPRIDAQGRDLEDVLNPLDAFLTRLVLDFTPGLPMLVDAAAAGTGGTSSLIGLNHRQVRKVVAVSADPDAPSRQDLSALRIHLRSRPAGDPPFEIISREHLREAIAGQSGVVILADARQQTGEALAADVERWLEDAPQALILILGLGRVGSCEAIHSLIGRCGGESGRRLWMMREVEETFVPSDLALVARTDHPHAEDVVQRIQLLHGSNYGYLDLLKTLSQTTMKATQVDHEVFTVHPSFGPLREEIEGVRQAHRRSSEALSLAQAELHDLRRGRVLRRTSFVLKLKRKIRPLVSDKLVRVAKRVARKGRSWIRSLD